jgi:cytochrome c5
MDSPHCLLASLPFAALTCLVTFTACGPPAAEQAELPAATEVVGDRLLLASAKVALPPPDVSPADLPDPNSRGAHLVTTYCALCHGLPTPALHSRTDWPSVLRRMWLRSEMVAGAFNVPVPTVAERIVIVEYMLDNALRVSAGMLPAGPGRDAFSVTCSQCHELPDPRQHSAADWVAVVRRMNTRMETMLERTLPRDDMNQIVLYLQNVSSGP